MVAWGRDEDIVMKRWLLLNEVDGSVTEEFKDRDQGGYY